ncbi:MAG: hypothetical protein ABSH48_12215 [Verrucomicrobiota bacterium]|jgi:hypothetical protein
MKTKLDLSCRLFVALAVGLAFNTSLLPAAAQGTAFTYQGWLFDGTNAATGDFDLRFHVYDSASGGTLLAGPITNAPVPVTNGLFTVELDFGPGVFTGSSNWLQIGVRTYGSSGGYSALSPRQQLTPTPYAIFAEGASAAGLTGTVPPADLSGTYGGVITLNNTANSFSGNGSGLINVNASLLGGLASSNFWQTTGNAGTTPGVNFVGTTDDEALYLESYGVRGLEVQYTSYFESFPFLYSESSVNVIGGYWGNTISNNIIGGTIAGGGDQSGAFILDEGYYPNTVTGDFGAVGGGYANTAGYAGAVPGGYENIATGEGSFAAGRYAQTTANGSFVWGDGSHTNTSTGANTFDVLASGGTLFTTPTLESSGIVRASGGSVSIQPAGSVFSTDGLVWGNGGLPGINGPTDSPFLAGYLGGALGAWSPNTVCLSWDAVGNVWVSNNCSVATLTIRGGSDLAEPFDISSTKGDVSRGAVVVIDKANPGHLKLSDQAYDAHVAGVVSGANGINPGIQMHQEGMLEGGENVALTGRVYVQADTSNGPIEPGDLLTTSGVPGHAMKVTDHTRAAGAILGKAMTGLEQGKGMVLVLVTLQ